MCVNRGNRNSRHKEGEFEDPSKWGMMGACLGKAGVDECIREREQDSKGVERTGIGGA